jgi:imidazoleglycerol-phosphate dehydratase
MGRTASQSRATKETNIEVRLDLDGTARADVQTPLPFLTHMVEQIARHGLLDLVVRATGDVEIDGHHTTEDLALVLGQCVAKALGDKA